MEESIAQKRCSGCGETKTVSEFYRHKRSSDGFQSWCKDCSKRAVKKDRIKHHEQRLEYGRKYHAAHREHSREYSKEYHSTHHEQRREYNKTYRPTHREIERKRNKRNALRVLYGLTVDDYNKMLSSQGGVCAICGKLPNGKSLYVDHDHMTGKIRGLLCMHCNTILGRCSDSAEILTRAIEYLNLVKAENDEE